MNPSPCKTHLVSSARYSPHPFLCLCCLFFHLLYQRAAQEMLENLKAMGQEKMEQSEFVHFIRQLASGDLSLVDGQVRQQRTTQLFSPFSSYRCL